MNKGVVIVQYNDDVLPAKVKGKVIFPAGFYLGTVISQEEHYLEYQSPEPVEGGIFLDQFKMSANEVVISPQNTYSYPMQ